MRIGEPLRKIEDVPRPTKVPRTTPVPERVTVPVRRRPEPARRGAYHVTEIPYNCPVCGSDLDVDQDSMSDTSLYCPKHGEIYNG